MFVVHLVAELDSACQKLLEVFSEEHENKFNEDEKKMLAKLEGEISKAIGELTKDFPVR